MVDDCRSSMTGGLMTGLEIWRLASQAAVLLVLRVIMLYVDMSRGVPTSTRELEIDFITCWK